MILQDVSDQPPRVVSPGGPNPPNAQALPTPRTRSPEAVPLDPSENENTELPIEDTLRHPELSFGPGTDNTATTMTPASGVGSSFSDQTLSKFSPEFAQNGGAFLGSIFANDTTVGKEYATF
jgi:hypothetical protein